jgi:hypothetical protein
MKEKGTVLTLLVLALACAGLPPVPGAAQAPATGAQPISAPLQTLAGNAFTYQGYLTDGGSPANGPYDFSFSLYADAAGTQWVTDAAAQDNVPVANGLFTVLVDVTDGMYGDVYFYLNGDARWLRIGVRPGDSAGAYTYLSPLQPLTPAPYALALPGLNTVQNATSANVIGGYSWNYVDPNAVGATIGGGGASGVRNEVLKNYGTVGGGVDNTAGGSGATVGGGAYSSAHSDMSTVGGGQQNAATGYGAAIGGGQWNTTNGGYATVAGGAGNSAGAAYATVAGGGWTTPAQESTANRVTDDYGTVGGGGNNLAGNADGDLANAHFATVGGGGGNTAAGSYATVPGGRDNYAGSSYSLAAGRRARANHAGSFVWADSTDADFASTATNQFRVRATNGAHLITNAATDGLYVQNDNTSGDGIHVSANVSMGSGWGAVYAYNGGSSPAVRADTATGTYSGYFLDNIYVAGTCVGCTLAYVALNGGETPLETGDLVAVGGLEAPLAGTTAPVLRVRRAGPGDAVVGVVRSRAQIVEGGQDGQKQQSAEQAAGPAAPGEYLFLVVQGLAQVKADARGGAIQPGQRLVAGEEPGYARAQRTVSLEGVLVAEGAAVAGIALAPLDTGTGLIPVLVTLR